MKQFVYFSSALALILAGLVIGEAQITIPNTFTSGTTISSSQVNANFSTLGTNALNRTGGAMTGTLTTVGILPSADNTYDLGSASFSFRDLFADRNALVGGTLGVTGASSLGVLGVSGLSTLAAVSATTGTFSSTLDVTGITTLTSPESTIKIGASTETAKLGGIINTDSVQAATAANTNDTTLFSYTLPADAMNANGRILRFTAWGSFAANGNTKTIRLKWNGTGGTSIMSYSASPNNQNWVIQGTVIRTGSSTQDYYGTTVLGPTAATNATFGTAAATDTGAITLHVTAQNGTAAASDIVYEGSLIEFLN